MGRLRGCLWLTAGLVVALLAGVVAFVTISRATAQRQAPVEGEQAPSGPTVQVVVAARAVTVRSALGLDDLATKEMPVEAVPEGAVAGIEDAQGKVTLVDLYPGEVILSQRLVDPNTITGDGRYALILAEEQVLMAFPAKDLMSQSRVLKPGDQVDLLFSLDMPTNRVGGVTGAPDPRGWTRRRRSSSPSTCCRTSPSPPWWPSRGATPPAGRPSRCCSPSRPRTRSC